jgi:hypothetical protein
MPVLRVPESTKTSLGQRLRGQARQRWPALAGVRARFRGRFAYVDGELGSGEVLPLCRLRYAGSASPVVVHLGELGRGDVLAGRRALSRSCSRANSPWTISARTAWSPRASVETAMRSPRRCPWRCSILGCSTWATPNDPGVGVRTAVPERMPPTTSSRLS